MRTAIEAGSGCILNLMTTADHSLGRLRPPTSQSTTTQNSSREILSCCVKRVKRKLAPLEEEEVGSATRELSLC